MTPPKLMQALQMRGLGELELAELPVPTPGPGITFKGSLKVRFGDEFFRRG